MIRIYPLTPISAPRQVRSDRWKPSPAVCRYRAYRDELRLKGLQVPEPFHHFIFVLPMAPSWSEEKKAIHEGMPHHLKPDRDNLEKAVLDAYFGEDRHIWHGATSKLWGRQGVLLVSDQFIPLEKTGRIHLERVYAECAVWRVNGHAHEQAHLLLVADRYCG